MVLIICIYPNNIIIKSIDHMSYVMDFWSALQFHFLYTQILPIIPIVRYVGM